MALSGSITGSILSGKYALRVDWSATQNVNNNTSKVTAVMYLVMASGWGLDISARSDNTATIAGTSYTWSSPAIDSSGGQTIKLATVTSGNITHNSDGAKQITISSTFNVRANINGTTYNTITASATINLNTIPRATTPTVSSTSVFMGSTVTISLSRASSSFTHDLAYSFAGSGYTSIATGVGTSYSWTTPDLATRIPSATSGILTLRCITKNGSTTVGTKYMYMTLKVLTSVTPSISNVSITEITEGLAAQFGAFIQGKSAVKVDITAAGVKGSTIVSYKSTLLSTTSTSKSFSTGVLTQAGTHSLVVSVTDSRGRSASKTVPVTVLPYTTPTTSEFKAFRAGSDGIAQNDGIYLSLAYGYSVAPCGGKNKATMVIEYKRSTASSWTTLATGADLEGSGVRVFVEGPTFSTDYVYDLRMTVTDWFGASASYDAELPSADVVLDISADGTGLCIGKVAQRSNATEFARDMYDQFDTLIGNGLAVYTGSGTAAIDPNTTLESLILTDKNTPSLTFCYILTYFYSTKSETANRTQFALSYQSVRSMYTRVYFNGAWTAWSEVPVKTGDYKQGIWHVRTWSDGWVDLTGTYNVSNLPCETALGSWFRTNTIAPGAYPVKVTNPVVTGTFEPDGYSAMLWGLAAGTSSTAPTYYLIRPAAATIPAGKIHLRVSGKQA